MSRPRIYLAGPITGLTFDGCTDWRKYVTEKLYPLIDCFSPLRGKEFLANRGALEGAYNENPIATAQGITTRDRFDVMNCDLVLMNLLGAERVSVGTMIEVGWADACRKPVLLAMDRGNLHEHPMIDGIAGWRVKSLDDAIELAKKILLP